MSGHLIVSSPPPPEARRLQQRAPRLTTDTHFHIFGPTDIYPLSLMRMYDPAFSPVASYLEMAGAIGIERMVVVQASIYGTDNRCLVDAIKQFGRHRARGICVVDQSTTREEFLALHDAGVRGIRFNAITGRTPIEWLPDLASIIEPLGWHIQLWIKSDLLLKIRPILERLTLPIVIDHMGQFPVDEGLESAEFQNIIHLLRHDRFWIKLVGYRVSKLPPDFADINKAARTMIEVAPDRCLWGSDWPHIYLEGRPMPNTSDLFENMRSWMSYDEAQKVFVENPARLYGFS